MGNLFENPPIWSSPPSNDQTLTIDEILYSTSSIPVVFAIVSQRPWSVQSIPAKGFRGFPPRESHARDAASYRFYSVGDFRQKLTLKGLLLIFTMREMKRR